MPIGAASSSYLNLTVLLPERHVFIRRSS